jgi:hypothetical protein
MAQTAGASEQIFIDGHMAKSSPHDDGWPHSAQSPSKRWRVQWTDEMTLDGRLARGRSRLLQDGQPVRTFTEVERPQDAVISDDGTVAILDWTTETAQRPRYRCAVLFYLNGRIPPFIHRFRANANRIYASHKSDLLVLELLDTPEEDEVRRARFRLSTGERLFANAWTS